MSDQISTTAPMQPLTVNIQYVKDLSFEVPGAPEIYTTLRSQPNVNINLDVQARRLQEGAQVYEVVLQIRPRRPSPRPPAPPTARRRA